MKMQLANLSQYTTNHAMPKLVNIAPAPQNYVTSQEPTYKKYNYKTVPYGAQSASIARRNARERSRVKQVNDGFNALRKKLPASVIAALSGASRRGSGKKLSKVDTLRMVVEYIRYLENLLENTDESVPTMTTDNRLDIEDMDEGVYGSSSPYSDSVPSPAASECSSGVSSAHSSGYFYDGYPQTTCDEMAHMGESELFDAISWWQQK